MSYIESVLTWLNGYQGAFTVILTFVLAASTIWYARLTRGLLHAGTLPQVVVYLVPNSRYIQFFEFVVANVGRGPAYDVSLEILTGRGALEQKGLRFREPASPFSVLPQDEKIRGYFGSASEILAEPPLPPIDVRVTFKNANGRKHSKDFRLDTTPYRSLVKLGKRPDEESAEALKKIADTMKGWSMGRLKVETITTEQKRRETSEWLKEAEAEIESEKKGQQIT